MSIFRGLPGVAVAVIPGVSVPVGGGCSCSNTRWAERFRASSDEISGRG